MTVFVVTHKKVALPSQLDSCYKILFVGNKRQGIDVETLLDSEGESISSRNSEYSELTGLYWIWRNVDSEIKGLVHYRRFFVSISPRRYLPKHVLSRNNINRILSRTDCIVPEKLVLNTSVKKHYLQCHVGSDWSNLKKMVAQRYPAYFIDFEYLEQQNWIYPYNMLIAKRDIFDAYCKWLFPLLDDVYSITNFSLRNNYQRRFIGFLSERLMSLWLSHNNINVVEKPIWFLNE